PRIWLLNRRLAAPRQVHHRIPSRALWVRAWEIRASSHIGAGHILGKAPPGNHPESSRYKPDIDGGLRLGPRLEAASAPDLLWDHLPLIAPGGPDAWRPR